MRLNQLSALHFEQLLNVLIDPEAAKKTLVSVKEAHEAAVKATDEANKRHHELDEREAVIGGLDATFDDQREEIKTKRDELTAMAAALDEREALIRDVAGKNAEDAKLLAEEKKAHATKMVALTQREQAVDVEVARKRAEADKLMDEAGALMAKAESAMAANQAKADALAEREAKLRDLLG